MSLKFCTLTGADDNTDSEALIELSKKYPFVEWGILYHANYAALPRYPSSHWIVEFLKNVEHADFHINTSIHLCGERTIAAFFKGEKEMVDLVRKFDRVQINQTRMLDLFTADEIRTSANLMKPVEITFQYRDHSRGLEEVLASLSNVSFLFDDSRGAGILPQEWKTPLYGFYCGYAGGLGPGNIEVQLPMIAKAAMSNDYWIDMETKLRWLTDKNLDKFGLDRSEFVLEKVQEYIDKTEIGLLPQSYPEGDMSNLFTELPVG